MSLRYLLVEDTLTINKQLGYEIVIESTF